MNKEDPQKYIKDLKEWQDHQYTPGYWTGGKIPFFYKSELKKLKPFIILLTLVILVFSVSFQLKNGFIYSLIIPELITSLTLWAALRS